MKLIACVVASLSLGQSAPVIKAGTVTPGDIALAVSRIPRVAPEKSPVQDSDSVAVDAPGVATYTRSIELASPEQIARHAARLRATLPETPPAHDAIADGSSAAKVVHYCRGGHWNLVH